MEKDDVKYIELLHPIQYNCKFRAFDNKSTLKIYQIIKPFFENFDIS